MPGPGVSFLARRARSSWLLLACVAVTVLLTTGFAAVLWTFAAGAITPGAQAGLADPHDRVMGISGLIDGQAANDSQLIRRTLRKAWPGISFQMRSALWANPVNLGAPGAGRRKANGSQGLPGPVAAQQIQIAALGGIRSQTTLTAGKWPGPPHAGEPLPVALPATVAGRLHLAPGSVLKHGGNPGPASAGLLVTGLFRPRDPASPYWALDMLPSSGITSHELPGLGGGSLVVYGPAVVNPAAFRSGLTAHQASWFVLPKALALARGNISALAGSTSGAATTLATATLPYGLQVTSRLPRVLAGLASTIVLARSLYTIAELELLLVAAAGLALAARLLAGLREEESALLRARGATRSQVVRPVLAEAVLLGAVIGVAGVLAGTRLTGLLARVGNLGPDGDSATGITLLSWLSALAMLALCAVVMAWPALRTMTPDAARTSRGRQARLAGIAWAGGDLAVVALAVLAVWELRGYSAVAHPVTGSLGIDPVVAVAPALAVAGVALIPLRTLPLLARVADKMTDHATRLTGAMVSWQIARRPIRQAGPVLLVVVATATTTLALAGYASWQRSAQDQAAYAVGSDVQVDARSAVPLSTAGAISRAPGVTAATPASIASIGDGAQLIALDASTAGKSVLLRRDLSPVPLTALWRHITPRRTLGLALPGQPDRLEVIAALGAGQHTTAAAARRDLGSVTVMASIQDAGGATYDLPAAGALPADGRPHALVVTLSGPRQATYPLRLLGLTLTYALPAYDPASPSSAPDGQLTIKSLAVADTARGPFPAPFCRGAALAAWSASGYSPYVPTGPPGKYTATPPSDGAQPAALRWRSATAGSRRLTFYAGHDPSASVMSLVDLVPQIITGQVALTVPPPRYIPVIVTSGYLASEPLFVGSDISLTLNGFQATGRIVASVTRFPTVFGRNRAVVADLAQVNDLLTAYGVMALPVTRWWLRTTDDQVPRLPPGLSVTSRAGRQAALLGNPLLNDPRKTMLAIGVAAMLIGVIGFSVSVAASLRARRTQSAVFAALGAGRKAQASQLCLEQGALSVPAAAAGLLAGTGLARLIVPAITLTTDATGPVPRALVILPLGPAIALAVITAAVPVVAAALSILRRPDPAAQLRSEAR